MTPHCFYGAYPLKLHLYTTDAHGLQNKYSLFEELELRNAIAKIRNFTRNVKKT